MVKVFSAEFNKDERDYRRFFQSRNVSLPKLISKSRWYDAKNVSGNKLALAEDSFLSLIAKKMAQKV